MSHASPLLRQRSFHAFAFFDISSAPSDLHWYALVFTHFQSHRLSSMESFSAFSAWRVSSSFPRRRFRRRAFSVSPPQPQLRRRYFRHFSRRWQARDICSQPIGSFEIASRFAVRFFPASVISLLIRWGASAWLVSMALFIFRHFFSTFTPAISPQQTPFWFLQLRWPATALLLWEVRFLCAYFRRSRSAIMPTAIAAVTTDTHNKCNS